MTCEATSGPTSSGVPPAKQQTLPGEGWHVHTHGLTQNYAVNGQPGERHKDKQLLLMLLSHIFIIHPETGKLMKAKGLPAPAGMAE